MNQQIETIELPAAWASYLINGDASSLDAEEIAAASEYIANYDVVDCVEETRIGSFDGLITEMLDYSCVRIER